MKKLALVVVVLGLSVTMSGCGGMIKYCKPGGTSSSFDADNYECRGRARQMAQFGGVYNPFEENSAYTDCMRYKGWSPCPTQE